MTYWHLEGRLITQPLLFLIVSGSKALQALHQNSHLTQNYKA